MDARRNDLIRLLGRLNLDQWLIDTMPLDELQTKLIIHVENMGCGHQGVISREQRIRLIAMKRQLQQEFTSIFNH